MRPKSAGLGFAEQDFVEEQATRKKSRDHDISPESDQHGKERFKAGYKRSRERHGDHELVEQDDSVARSSLENVMMQTRTSSLHEPTSFSVMDASGPRASFIAIAFPSIPIPTLAFVFIGPASL